MPTTSHPPRRSRSSSAKAGSDPKAPAPLKRISLKVTLRGPRKDGVERLALENGLTVKKEGKGLTLEFTATNADEALERLQLITKLITPTA